MNGEIETGSELEDLCILLNLPSLRVVNADYCNDPVSAVPFPPVLSLSRVKSITFYKSGISKTALRLLVDRNGAPCTLLQHWWHDFELLPEFEDCQWRERTLTGEIGDHTGLILHQSRVVSIRSYDEDSLERVRVDSRVRNIGNSFIDFADSDFPFQNK